MTYVIPGFVVLLGYSLLYSLPSEAGTISVACPGQSLQAAVDAAQPGDIIQLSGGCSENILIRNEKQRITIVGVGFLNGINAPDHTLPAINVRGKGILIQKLVITGGRSGVHVNRGSNAVIDHNLIDTNTESGVRVDQQSFAVITNSTISNNSTGIFVDQSSSVRVGYNLDTDSSPSPNTIQNNNLDGILVQGASDARIAGNTITSNLNAGIYISNNANAVIGGNNIGLNLNGVVAANRGSVQLGFGEAPSFLGPPNNSNAGSNNNFGVGCTAGGSLFGDIGTLSGIVSNKGILGNCLDELE